MSYPYAFDKPDFQAIKIAAYDLLLNQSNPHVGMKAESVIIPGKKLLFGTIQEYSNCTGVDMKALTKNGKISLGLHVNLYNKHYLLLHNEEINYFPCENWTNMHEIGHICLCHEENGDKEEVEAHFFAACFVMPDPVIRYIENSGIRITNEFLVEYFNVSPEAAEKKIHYLETYNYPTYLDDDIIHALRGDINFIMRDFHERPVSFINFANLFI